MITNLEEQSAEHMNQEVSNVLLFRLFLLLGRIIPFLHNDTNTVHVSYHYIHLFFIPMICKSG